MKLKATLAFLNLGLVVAELPYPLNSPNPSSVFHYRQSQELEFVLELLHNTSRGKEFHAAEDLENYETDDDYMEEKQPYIFNPCDPRHCLAHFTNQKIPYDLSCSVASGRVPQIPQLPLVFAGNYDLCSQLEFAGAHFCTIEAGPIIAPLLDPDSKSFIPKPVDFFNLGYFFLGQCVPNECTSNILKKRFTRRLMTTASRLTLKAKKTRFDILVIASILESTVKVHCSREDRLNQGEEYEVMGTTLFFFLLALFFAFVFLFSTAYSAPRTIVICKD